MATSRLKNKVVLITGASAGIGQALAGEFARHGAKLILAARREERLEELKKSIHRAGDDILISKCDVTRPSDLQNTISQAKEKFGIIDIVTVNAAIPMSGKFETIKIEDYRKVFETNVFGALQTCYATIETLKKSQGTLVLIGSIAGYMSSPGSSAYAMSKYALRAFAEALHGELKPQHIKVVLLSLGFIQSELRMIDNNGNYHSDRKDWVPSFLVMPADKAAGKMVKAIIKGKRETFITFHGYLAYWVRQYLPWLYFAVINHLNKKFRPHHN